jgi:hypothetical protein
VDKGEEQDGVSKEASVWHERRLHASGSSGTHRLTTARSSRCVYRRSISDSKAKEETDAASKEGRNLNNDQKNN